MASVDMTGVAAILLAAGSSRRFGADKQLAVLDGASLLRRSARLLLDAGFARPIVVLRSGADEHRAALSGLDLRLLENPQAFAGLSSSIAVGMDFAGSADAVLLTVCDQPAVTAKHLHALVAIWRAGEANIVCSRYAETVGVPALFAAGHFPELRALEGDRGAGPILAQHRDSLSTVALPRGALDIDTPEDLARFRRERNRH